MYLIHTLDFDLSRYISPNKKKYKSNNLKMKSTIII